MPARAFWVTDRCRGEIRDEVLRDPQPGELLVRTRFSGISRGTESTVFRGGVPASEHQRMRAPHQAGDFPWPVKYGYACVGRVEQGPDDWVGREVFCLHPHQTHFVVPLQAAHPLPDRVPAARAVLAANMETAINGIWDAGLKLGDRVRVVGAGVVGSLFAYLAQRHPGCEVQLVDVDPDRARVSRDLDVSFCSPEEADGAADLVCHASGHPEGLHTALKLAGQDARVLELSWYGDREVTLPLGQAFHAQRLTLRSSQVGRLTPEQTPRWDHTRRMALALSLLRDGALDALITGESAFEDLPHTLARLSDSPGGTLCERVRYA